MPPDQTIPSNEEPFFEDKAVEKLLGDEIKSEYLNDDKIGRFMDEIYQIVLNSLFRVC